MDIMGRRVDFPDELQAQRRQQVVEVPRRDIGPVIEAILSLLLIVLGSTGVGVGVGLWVHPGAGIAAGSLLVFVVGVLLGYGSGE